MASSCLAKPAHDTDGSRGPLKPDVRRETARGGVHYAVLPFIRQAHHRNERRTPLPRPRGMDRQHRLRHVRLQVLFAQPPDPGRGQARHPRLIRPAFRGDRTRWNPEDLLVGSLSACHKLWYLHLCAVEGVRVLSYRDEAEGLMAEDPERGGRSRGWCCVPSSAWRRGGHGAGRRVARARASLLLHRQFGEFPGAVRAAHRRGRLGPGIAGVHGGGGRRRRGDNFTIFRRPVVTRRRLSRLMHDGASQWTPDPFSNRMSRERPS